MRVGYAKLGRTIKFDKDQFGFQGDAESPYLLDRLARRNPEHTWVLIGKNTGFTADEHPPNVTNLWRDDVPRAPFLHANQEHCCTFCKSPTPPGHDFTCCDRGRYAYEYHAWVVDRIAELDAFVIHVGQHGNTHSSIPPSSKTWASGVRTNTYVWARNYGRYLIQGLNAAGDRTDGRVPVVWICGDPRNYLKARDLKWPTGMNDILAQHTYQRTCKFDRWLDEREPRELGFPNAKWDPTREMWIVTQSYRHGGSDMMILPDDWETWGAKDFEDRRPAGIATTAFWYERMEERRSWLVRHYLLHAFGEDAQLRGKWDAKSLTEIEPYEVVQEPPHMFAELLGSWRITLSLPPAARGANDAKWCVSKPWQCFAARVACFMVDPVDYQGWVLPSRHRSQPAKRVAADLWSVRDDWTEDELHLARWLRVRGQDDFVKKVRVAAYDEATWSWLVDVQRTLLRRRWDEAYIERSIEATIGITPRKVDA